MKVGIGFASNRFGRSRDALIPRDRPFPTCRS
jgi:hypothetical protein